MRYHTCVALAAAALVTALPQKCGPFCDDLPDPQEICTSERTIDLWNAHDMDGWLSTFSSGQSITPWTDSYRDHWKSTLPGLANWDCFWSASDGTTGCTQPPPEEACADDPKAFFAVEAVYHWVAWMAAVRDSWLGAAESVNSLVITLTGTFNPDYYISVESVSSQAGTAASILYYLGSFAGLIPGVGALFTTVTPALTKAAGGIGAASYMGGSIAGVENLSAGGDTNIEVQFNEAAKQANFTGVQMIEFARNIKTYMDQNLDQPPRGDPERDFADRAQVPDLLAGGGFADSLGSIPSAIEENARAALAAPLITMVWQKVPVVVAKANANNLPIDPCNPPMFGDAGYCDEDGNMFVLQTGQTPKALTEDSPPTLNEYDPANHAVPGFDQLGIYSLTAADFGLSSWRNQQANGAAADMPGDSTELYENVLAQAKTGEAIDRYQYVFSNLFVCDFDAVAQEDIDAAVDTAGCDNESNDFDDAQRNFCVFYTYLDSACRNLDYGKDKDGKDKEWPYSALGNTQT